MKGFIILLNKLPVSGMCIFPFLLFKKVDWPVGEILINHERIHLKQQLELLILPFYIWYIVEYFVWRIKGLKHVQAYLEISFEKEAYSNQGNLEYLKKRKSWNFLNYLRK